MECLRVGGAETVGVGVEAGAEPPVVAVVEMAVVVGVVARLLVVGEAAGSELCALRRQGGGGSVQGNCTTLAKLSSSPPCSQSYSRLLLGGLGGLTVPKPSSL